MKKSTTFKKVISSVIVGGLLLSMAGIAMAKSTTAKQANKTLNSTVQKSIYGMRGMMNKRGFDPATMQADFKTNLAKLVTAGTITQAQANSIIAEFTQEQATKAAEFAKIKAMTETEREQYFQANKDKAKRVNPLSQLVTAGTITQAQANAIMKAMPMHQKGGRGVGMPGKGVRGMGGMSGMRGIK